MQIFNLIGYFSHTDCPIFLKIKRVEAIDEIDKLCKLHEKCRLYRIIKKKTNGRTDERRKPCHDISSAGFQPVELKL